MSTDREPHEFVGSGESLGCVICSLPMQAERHTPSPVDPDCPYCHGSGSVVKTIEPGGTYVAPCRVCRTDIFAQLYGEVADDDPIIQPHRFRLGSQDVTSLDFDGQQCNICGCSPRHAIHAPSRLAELWAQHEYVKSIDPSTGCSACGLAVTHPIHAVSNSKLESLRDQLSDAEEVIGALEVARELTQQYFGKDAMPDIEGWSHYDAHRKVLDYFAKYPMNKERIEQFQRKHGLTTDGDLMSKPRQLKPEYLISDGIFFDDVIKPELAAMEERLTKTLLETLNADDAQEVESYPPRPDPGIPERRNSRRSWRKRDTF